MKRLLDLVAQRRRASGKLLHPDPQIARPVAAKDAGSRELQHKPACPQPQQCLVDIGLPDLADLADEAQGQAAIAGIDPARLWYPLAQQRQPRFLFWP